MLKASLRNGYMLLLFILFSFVLNEIVILGNDLIAESVDLMLSGRQVYFQGL